MTKNRNEKGDRERVKGDFPIKEINGNGKMKNISPSSLPHFHGMTSEDPNTFFFEFDVIYRTYHSTYDDQKLKLFPSTLKDAVLCWFMGLLRDSVTAWA